MARRMLDPQEPDAARVRRRGSARSRKGSPAAVHRQDDLAALRELALSCRAPEAAAAPTPPEPGSATRRRRRRARIPAELAEPLRGLEEAARGAILQEQAEEAEVAKWAYLALKANRIWTFNSRITKLELGLVGKGAPGRGSPHEPQEVRNTVLDSRQRYMASVVLDRLTEPSVHRRQQLEEMFRGAGALEPRLPDSLPRDTAVYFNKGPALDVCLRW
eukprot:TRINITY_DN14190_c0_g1_i1.p1 TRINITY_DN14190_c0_g1~~TRINITY_DN14190_c0_g1_i1.p1  ORF type:complete len:247 (+),score=56.25 TRINITY_DN14190_c0_g1_i1:89-742(+)